VLYTGLESKVYRASTTSIGERDGRGKVKGSGVKRPKGSVCRSSNGDMQQFKSNLDAVANECFLFKTRKIDEIAFYVSWHCAYFPYQVLGFLRVPMRGAA
jgi:hypothetical protein